MYICEKVQHVGSASRQGILVPWSTPVSPRVPCRLDGSSCIFTSCWYDEVDGVLWKALRFEVPPDSLHVINLIESLWTSGWLSPCGEVKRSGSGWSWRGMSMVRSIAVGNQGWLGQYGVMRAISASSTNSFNRRTGMRLNGGKQYPSSPFQLRLNASTFQAPGWGNQLTNWGSCLFQPLANRSLWIFQIEKIILKIRGESFQSPVDRGRLDSLSANVSSLPGTKIAFR